MTIVLQEVKLHSAFSVLLVRNAASNLVKQS